MRFLIKSNSVCRNRNLKLSDVVQANIPIEILQAL